MPEAPISPASLPTRHRLFVERFVAFRDLKAVSDYVCERHKTSPPSFTLAECEALWERKEVREECERRIELEEIENAKALAKAGRLRDPGFLDSHAVENIEDAEPGSDKTKALALAYTVVGLLAKNELAVPPEKNAQPNVYRALHTTTVRRITEEVTQTTELPVEQPALPVIIPADPEILDY